VRDAVIDYITAMGTVSPMIEGRLLFGDTVAPVITIISPEAKIYPHSNFLTIDFDVTDAGSGVAEVVAKIDDKVVTDGQVVDLLTLSLGSHTFTVVAKDFYGYTSTQSVTFKVTASIQTLMATITRYYEYGLISKADVYWGLRDKLVAAQKAKQPAMKINILYAFINLVEAQKGKAITMEAANLLITDAQWVIDNLK
jgi:hypothetical protein